MRPAARADTTCRRDPGSATNAVLPQAAVSLPGLAELGEFAQAIAAGEEGIQIAQTAGHPYSEVWARAGLGYAHLRHGDFAAATRVLEQGLALCRATEIRAALPSVAASLGSAYLWSGRAADAMPLLDEAVEAITAMGMLGVRSLSTFRAEAYLVLGRIAEAREQAEQAVALARAHQERGFEAWGLKLLGDVHAHEPAEIDQGGVEQAGDAYRQALAAATELGMRPLVAHCHVGLGKLHASPHPQPLSRPSPYPLPQAGEGPSLSGERVARTDQREAVREHLATAVTMYREMDMRFWLEQAESALKAL